MFLSESCWVLKCPDDGDDDDDDDDDDDHENDEEYHEHDHDNDLNDICMIYVCRWW